MCNILHLGQGNPWYQYRLRDKAIESSPAKRDFRALVDEKLDMSRQYVIRSPESRSGLVCWPPYPELHQKQRGQQVEGGDSATLLHSDETPPGVLHPALEPSAQERHGPVGPGLERGHKN